MNIKNTSILLSIVAIAVSVVAFTHKNVPAPQQPSVIVKGASAEISSPYLVVNGVNSWYYQESMRAATTSLCSFLAPLGTTTIARASFSIITGTSTSALIDIATSTNNYGTTTANSLYLTASSVPANVSRANAWYGSGSQSNYLIYSSTTTPTYVNFLTEGAGSGGYTYGGTCSIVFSQL